MSQSSVFIPYKEKKPKLVEVKGHNLLIIGNNPEHLRDGLELIGADKVKKVTFRSEFEQGLAKISARS